MSNVYIVGGNPGRPPKDMRVITRRDEILVEMARFHIKTGSMPNLQRLADLLPYRISRAAVEKHVKKLLKEGRLEQIEGEAVYRIPKTDVIIAPESIPDIPLVK